MQVHILDLDGAMASQSSLGAQQPLTVPLRDWGPRIRLGCSPGQFQRFTHALARHAIGGEARGPIVSLCGSGDFHHVSLALVSRLQTPFNLLVLDTHPDWMRGIPLMHCGTWLYHAARLPQVQQIFHVGGDVDFDNGYRWLAPWPQLRAGKIIVFPARRHYTRGGWRHVGSHPLDVHGDAPLMPAHLDRLLRPFERQLARYPLYVSVDKDVLVEAEAVVNWDSGHLRLAEMLLIVRRFLAAARGRLAGMDTVGDWSAVEVKGLLRRALHVTEHTNMDVDPVEAARRNERVNRALLETVQAAATCAAA